MGAAVILWVGYRLTLGRDILAAQKAAGASIARAFHPELDALVQTDEDARLIMTDDTFKKHESTIRNNRRQLSWLRQLRLRHAWQAVAYHPQDNEQGVPFYAMYADCGSLNKRRQMRPVAIARIEKIISIVS